MNAMAEIVAARLGRDETATAGPPEPGDNGPPSISS